MNNSRRDFLKKAAFGAAFGFSGLLDPSRLFAAPPGQGTPTLVTIYLRGGADALNMIVPYRDELYVKYRQTIHIPAPPEVRRRKKKKRRIKAGLSEAEKKAIEDEKRREEQAIQAKLEEEFGKRPHVIPLNDEFGLHPSLSSLQPLWKQGLFVPILCVGSKNPTRSHFMQQDCMDYATLAHRHHSGWLNRYLQATKQRDHPNKLRAVSVQRLLPRSMRGRYSVLAMDTLEGADEPISVFRELYGDPAKGTKTRGKETLEELARRRSEAADPDAAMRETIKVMGQKTIDRMGHFRRYLVGGGGSANYPQHGLAGSLRKTAQLIKSGSGLEVASVDYGGWDHHRSEGGSDGAIAKKLRILGDSLAAFMEDLGDKKKNVLVLVLSEFGRTARENGNRGTDHGRGGLMFAVGGNLNGGKIYGKWAGLHGGALEAGRDLPVLIDYRDVFAECLTAHMGLEIGRKVNADFFPQYKPKLGTDKLAFIKQA